MANKTKKNTPHKSKNRAFVFVTVAGLLAYFIWSIFSLNGTLSQKKQELSAVQGKVAAATKQNEQLKMQFSSIGTPEFIESRARESLGFVTPNEKVFIDANKN